ncbi:hypothetical protein DD237_006226 [Peronospora effusa]|uniref:Uncharacterized protein n=1 Tax=Peronospora effusa TaxID=542832 RepID=A0A3R7W5K5_9STRA|nr:hypothetical protein DD237_006226 [Peronospora effusa]
MDLFIRSQPRRFFELLLIASIRRSGFTFAKWRMKIVNIPDSPNDGRSRRHTVRRWALGSASICYEPSLSEGIRPDGSSFWMASLESMHLVSVAYGPYSAMWMPEISSLFSDVDSYSVLLITGFKNAQHGNNGDCNLLRSS